ncbi:hypothetical protein ACMUE1_00600, partial [Candidatus Phytoplasma asteris]
MGGDNTQKEIIKATLELDFSFQKLDSFQIETHFLKNMIKEFGENGGLNFSEGIFDEKDNNQENKENNNLDEILKENLKLKNQL